MIHEHSRTNERCAEAGNQRGRHQSQLAEEKDIPEVVLEVPKDKSHGDYSTNMAMQLARIAKKAPRNIAEEIVSSFDKGKASIDKLDIAGRGLSIFTWTINI